MERIKPLLLKDITSCIKYFFHPLLIIALLTQGTSTVCRVGVSIFRYVYRKKKHGRSLRMFHGLEGYYRFEII